MEELSIKEYLYKGVCIMAHPAIQKREVKNIEKKVEVINKLKGIESNEKLYEFLIKDYLWNVLTKETYRTLEEYRLLRMKKNKSREIINAIAKIHKFISLNFQKELSHFNDEEITEIIKRLEKNCRNNRASKIYKL